MRQGASVNSVIARRYYAGATKLPLRFRNNYHKRTPCPSCHNLAIIFPHVGVMSKSRPQRKERERSKAQALAVVSAVRGNLDNPKLRPEHQSSRKARNNGLAGAEIHAATPLEPANAKAVATVQTHDPMSGVFKARTEGRPSYPALTPMRLPPKGSKPGSATRAKTPNTVKRLAKQRFSEPPRVDLDAHALAVLETQRLARLYVQDTFKASGALGRAAEKARAEGKLGW